ncbi:MAG: hypothetical protein H5T66_09820 [Chloroflexi bacterium]|nr:hypothetical protein [Chloroflexota bacterium]
MSFSEGRPRAWGLAMTRLAAWLVSTALVIVDLFVLRRLVFDILVYIGRTMSPEKAHQRGLAGASFGWEATFWQYVAVILLACLGIVAVIGVDYYFRQSADKRQLFKRILRVLGIQVAIGAVCYGASFLFV